MVPIAFSILSAAACVFLVYVLAQFHRELARVRKSSAGAARLAQTGRRHIEVALRSAREFSRGGEWQRTKNEAVMRKEVVTSAIVGLVGLLAPFIFVLLLNSPWLR